MQNTFTTASIEGTTLTTVSHFTCFETPTASYVVLAIIVAAVLIVVEWMKPPFWSACLEPRRSGEAAMFGHGFLRGPTPPPRPLVVVVVVVVGLFGSVPGSVVRIGTMSFGDVSVLGFWGL